MKIVQHGPHYKAENKLTVAIDFSSPNIAKDLHVGHLRFFASLFWGIFIDLL
jgi:arginyl-tRNA synthetase